MRVLLVGGTGVLSSAVTQEALRRQFEVAMINRGRRTIPDGVELIKADRSDYSTIAERLGDSRFDAVIDFLCYTEKALEASFNFYHNYTDQYFFISSCAVYNTALGGVMTEDSPKVLPVWDYSVNKWKGEQRLTRLAQEAGCNYTIIRPGVTYGDTRIPYGIMPLYGYHWTLCARILAGKPIIRWNKGTNKCNMMRVEDFAIGVVGLIGNPRAYNEAFNICGDEVPSFNDVLEALQEELHHEIKVVDIDPSFYAKEAPHRAGEILGGRSIDALYSNAKIKSAVPLFHQEIGLKEGMAMTLRAYREQNYQKGIDFRFDAETDRIIDKWCRRHKEDTSGLNLRFYDYLGSATDADKKVYWLEFHKGNPLVKGYGLAVRLVNKLKRTLS